MSEVMTKYLTVEEVASILRLHWQTVLDLIKDGSLPAIKIGRSYRIDPADFASFKEEKNHIRQKRILELYNSRVDELATSAKYKDNRLLILGCGLDMEIDNIFSESGAAFTLLNTKTSLRSMGWTLDSLKEQPTPKFGEYLGYDDDVRFIRIYRDGMILVGGAADSKFLGWTGQILDDTEQQEERAIKALAVAEFIANFAVKAYRLREELLDANEDVVMLATILNPRINKIYLKSTPGSIFPSENIGDYFQLKEKTVKAIIPKENVHGPEILSGAIWKEICYLFGLSDERIPYMNQSQLNHEQISAIR